MTDWTPLPGVPISGYAADKLISEFRRKYRKPRPDQPENIPTWCTFPDEMPSERTDIDVLAGSSVSSISEYEKLYLYVENTGEVNEALPEMIHRYFVERNPWEESLDQYIFDPDMEWCIAVTHKQADDVAVIRVGSL